MFVSKVGRKNHSCDLRAQHSCHRYQPQWPPSNTINKKCRDNRYNEVEDLRQPVDRYLRGRSRDADDVKFESLVIGNDGDPRPSPIESDYHADVCTRSK